jgi:hypothetical protein
VPLARERGSKLGLETLLKLTERYCVVFQTLASPPLLRATLASG